MKTRIIQTRFYEDNKVAQLSYEGQNLFMYLLTCRYINISGIFELSDRSILYEHKCNAKQLEKAKRELVALDLVRFCDGWVYVVNAEKNNKYRNSPDNQKAYDKELERIPSKILQTLKGNIEADSDSSVYSTVRVLPTVVRNSNIEIEGGMGETKNTSKRSKEYAESLEFYESIRNHRIYKDYEITQQDILFLINQICNWAEGKGKIVKDYAATARTWLDRRIISGEYKKRTGNKFINT